MPVTSLVLPVKGGEIEPAEVQVTARTRLQTLSALCFPRRIAAGKREILEIEEERGADLVKPTSLSYCHCYLCCSYNTPLPLFSASLLLQIYGGEEFTEGIEEVVGVALQYRS
ncbi:hypothetical protein PIB30_048476 [Stylosanthes scabra]|uniref:Uncharacterized protein n=1 Tax=Stylosanthes scabra TaxID=79078 RepID=A0ABU6QH96_9FABA|nr:hypothetical protein [Stylosanthes scabra]